MLPGYLSVVTIFVLVIVLVSSGFPQQNSQSVTQETAAAKAFEGATQAEAQRHFKRIYPKHVQNLCTADNRRWGDGVVAYDRVGFTNEQELTLKMTTLVREWKTIGATAPAAFTASEFQRLRRYSIAYCGTADGRQRL